MARHNRVLDNISDDRALIGGESGIIRQDNVKAIQGPPAQESLTVGNLPSSAAKFVQALYTGTNA